MLIQQTKIYCMYSLVGLYLYPLLSHIEHYEKENEYKLAKT